MKSARMAPATAQAPSPGPFRMKKILVPTDFTDASLLALQHARGFAELFEAKLEVVHVVPNLVPPMSGSEVKKIVSEAQEQAVRFMGQARFNCPVHVTYGDLLDELNVLIREHDIDLVVIGTSGRKGASRLLLGSMAEYIFRGLSAPVLAMGPEAKQPLNERRPIEHIVLCESLVPDAQPAMQYGCALAEHTGAMVTVVHTLPESLKDSARAVQFQRMFEDELRSGATHPEMFGQADYIVTFGDTAKEVVRVAKSVKASLIVLGAKPAEMWQTHLGRGTAYRIMGAAPCPILSVRSTPAPTK